MYKYTDINSLTLELLKLAREEYNYLLNLKSDEEYEDIFLLKKQELREKIDSLLKNSCLNKDEKIKLKDSLKECYSLEKKIETLYGEKLQLIKKNIANLNKEKKIKEAYAKSGMDFNLDKYLKKT